MDAEIVIFSVDTMSTRDLIPWDTLLIILGVIFGPLIIWPMALKSRTEATGKRAVVVASVIVGAIFAALFLQSSLALNAQKDALENGEFTVLSGRYEGAKRTDLTIASRLDGVRMAGQNLAPPGGLLGAWSGRTVPGFVAEGQQIDVAVLDGVYLQIARK